MHEYINPSPTPTSTQRRGTSVFWVRQETGCPCCCADPPRMILIEHEEGSSQQGTALDAGRVVGAAKAGVKEDADAIDRRYIGAHSELRVCEGLSTRHRARSQTAGRPGPGKVGMRSLATQSAPADARWCSQCRTVIPNPTRRQESLQHHGNRSRPDALRPRSQTPLSVRMFSSVYRYQYGPRKSLAGPFLSGSLRPGNLPRRETAETERSCTGPGTPVVMSPFFPRCVSRARQSKGYDMYKTLLTATALSGLLALSANALEIGAGANAGINFDDGLEVSAGVSANADAGSNESEMSPEDLAKQAAADAGYAIVADSAFLGNTVETIDGVVVGTVTDVYGKADADSRVRVEFNEAAGISEPDGFWLAIGAGQEADGKLVLPMTLAELNADMAAKVEANG